MKNRFAFAFVICCSVLASLLVGHRAGATGPIVRFGGDLTGNMTTQTVTGLQGFGVSATVPSSGNVLSYSSGLWRPSAFSTSNLSPGTPGQVLITNGSTVPAWTSLMSLELTHGRLTLGGTGSDYKVVSGPMPSFETSDAGVWAVPTGTTPSSANVLVHADGSSGFINAAGPSGSIGFTQQGSYTGKVGPYSGTTYGLWIGQGAGFASNNLAIGSDASSVTFVNAPLAASDLQLRFGGNTAMQFDAGTQNGVALGANVATAGHMRGPAGFVWSDRTANNLANHSVITDDGSNDLVLGDVSGWGSVGVQSAGAISFAPNATTTLVLTASGSIANVLSNTPITSLVLGTNNAGATLKLQADATSTVETLSKVSSTSSSAVFSSPGLAAAATINVNDNGAAYFGSGTLTTNYILFNGVTNSYVASSGGQHVFADNAANTFATLSNAGIVVKGAGTPAVRGDTTVSTLTVGTNKAGASLVLQGDAATTIQTISASGTDHTQIAAPAAPSAGNVRVYVDGADGKLKAKDPSGNVFVLAP